MERFHRKASPVEETAPSADDNLPSRRRIAVGLILLITLGFIGLSLINTIRVQGSWELVAIDGVPYEYPGAANLTFNGRSVGGYDGCNSFSGLPINVGPWLNISYRAQTLMFCGSLDGYTPNPEQTVIKGWSRISVSGDQLRMTSGGVTLDFAKVD